MDNIFLVEPSIGLKEQFTAMVQNYELSGELDYIDLYKAAMEDFDKYVEKLNNNAKGIDVPEDWVPSCTYWLTNEQSEILGVIRIRTSLDNDYVSKYAGHIGYDIAPRYRGKGYGNMILKLGLEKARALDLGKILITCDFDNYGSIKVIENNGGIFESEIFKESMDKNLRRYWIEL